MPEERLGRGAALHCGNLPGRNPRSAGIIQPSCNRHRRAALLPGGRGVRHLRARLAVYVHLRLGAGSDFSDWACSSFPNHRGGCSVAERKGGQSGCCDGWAQAMSKGNCVSSRRHSARRWLNRAARSQGSLSRGSGPAFHWHGINALPAIHRHQFRHFLRTESFSAAWI